MKIGVNARLLTKLFTGIGQVTRNLIRELAKIDKKNEYILVVHEKVPVKIRKEFPKNVRIKIIPEKKIGPAGVKKTWWEQIAVPEYFAKEGVEMAIFTYPCNPWTNDFYKKGIRTCVMVHDCIPWIFKEYRKKMVSRMYHYQSRRAVKKADLIVTVSENSKKDIVKICDAKARKIHVIYNDAGDAYGKRHEGVARILKKNGVKRGEFYLYVGGYDERKNVSYMVEEFKDRRPLVLTGGSLFKEKDGGSLLRTGFLNEEELAVLYANCAAFINLSKYEGFNLPIVEAANCGAPLILSDIKVHREIAGNAAKYVDLRKKGELEKALVSVKRRRDSYSKKSKVLAKKYSWEKSAKGLRDVLFS